MEYQDFVLQVGEESPEGYAVRVLASPAGEGHGRWRPRLSAAELAVGVGALSGRDFAVETPATVPPVRPRELSRALFADLETGSVGRLLEASLLAVGDGGLRVRVELSGDHPHLSRLAAIPWELLAHPWLDGFLATDPRTPVVRHLEVPGAAPPVTPPREPLCILLASSSPSGAAALQLEREQELIQRAWVRTAAVEVDVVQAAGLASLRRALFRKPYRVLHFMGHGSVDPQGDEGALLLEDEDGRMRPTAAADVAVKLQGLPALDLIVLNACETARSPRGLPYAGVATRLVRGGAPAVVAMQFAVADSAAVAFSEALHLQLAAGAALEEAVAEGRQAMHSLDPASHQWLAPVLFLRGISGTRRLAHPQSPRRGRLLAGYLSWVEAGCSRVRLPVAEAEAGSLEIPLRRVFAELAAEAACAVPAAVQRETPIRTVADLMQRRPSALLVGEVGSGKTTLLRWLAATLARSAAAGGGRAEVEAASLDPEADDDAAALDLGLARVPILIHLPHFAAARRRDPALTLTAYLGRHVADAAVGPAAGELGEEIPPQELHQLLRELLGAGEAVVLLDELDAVPALAERHDVAREIVRFCDAWGLAAAPADGAEGLRLLVTSRPLGVAATIFEERLPRFRLQPLSKRATERLTELLLAALRGIGDGSASGAARPSELPSVQDLLAAAVRPTPWTVALVVLAWGTEEPRRSRALLCEEILRRWVRHRRRGSDGFDATAGAQGEHELLARYAAALRDSDSAPAVDDLPAELEEARHVGVELGLLGRDGEAFFHPWLADVLAARALLLGADWDAEAWRRRLSVPAWREPVILALGLLSAEPEARFVAWAGALMEPVSAATPPRAALSLVAALPELVRLPGSVAEAAARQLLDALAAAGPHAADATGGGRGTGGGALGCSRSLRRAFSLLAASSHEGVAEGVERALVQALRGGDAGRVAAAATLLCHGGNGSRLTAELAAALSAALVADSESWDWPVSRALGRLGGQEPALLPTVEESLRRSLSQRPALARRLLADAAWSSLAVILGDGLDDDGRVRVEAMYRDTPLSAVLLEALEAGLPAVSLVPRLRELAAAPDDAAEESAAEKRADALVALTVLGAVTAGELRRPTAAAELARRHLRRWARRLGDVVPRAMAQELARCGAAGPGKADWPCLLPLLDLALSWAPRQVQPLGWLPSAPGELAPSLLAAAWRHMVRQGGYEGLYQACLALDLYGADLAASPRVLARSLVLAGGHAAGGWDVEIPASRDVDGGAGELALALDAVAALPEPFGCVAGWLLQHLAGSLTQEGFATEALIVALGRLDDRFDARSRAVAALCAAAPELLATPAGSAAGWLGCRQLAAALHAQVLRLREPWRSSRALVRLVELFPDAQSLLEERVGLLPRTGWGAELSRLLCRVGLHDPLARHQAASATASIPRAAWRCRAYEALARIAPPPLARRWWQAARATAERLGDAGERALAFARLAVSEPGGDWSCLERRARQAAQAGGEALVDELEAVLAGRRRVPRWLPAAGSGAGRGAVLGSIAAAVERVCVPPVDRLDGDESARWGARGTSPASQGAGERLHRGDARRVEERLREGDLAEAVRLLRRCRRPLSDVVPAVRRWSQHENQEVRCLAALLLAEAGRLTAPSVPLLVTCLRGDDLVRQRAALALHGDRGAGAGRLTTGGLGRAGVEALAKAWIAHRFEDPPVTKVLEWTFERLTHTDGGALDAWCGAAVESPVARCIVGRVDALEGAAWPVFLEALRDGAAPTRRSLLRSLCWMLARGRVPGETWPRVEDALCQGKTDPGEERFVLAGPAALVDAVEAVAGVVPDVATDLTSDPVGASAMAVLVSRSVDWTSVLALRGEELRATLAAVGGLSVASPAWERRLQRAAARCEASPRLLPALVAWLAHELRRPNVESGLASWTLGELLALTAAVAERLPAGFRRAAVDHPWLDKLLSDMVRFHPAFVARRSALLLLARLGRVTPQLVEALRSALRDVVEVERASLAAVRHLDDVDTGAVDDLARELVQRELDGGSAAVVWTAARILGRLALHPRLPARVRERAMAAVEAAALDPRARRELVMLQEQPGRYGSAVLRLRSHGDLGRALGELLAQVRGDWIFAPQADGEA